MDDQRRRNLRAALGFLRLQPIEPELRLMHRWLETWRETRLPLIASFVHPQLLEVFLHATYDDYWRELDPATRYADFAVPIYHECGWFDRYVRPTIQHFNGIRAESTSAAPAATRPCTFPEARTTCS